MFDLLFWHDSNTITSEMQSLRDDLYALAKLIENCAEVVFKILFSPLRMPISKLSFILITVVLMLLASCTVTKRRYMNGYHIEWADHLASHNHELKKEERNEVDQNHELNVDGELEDIADTLTIEGGINIMDSITRGEDSQKKRPFFEHKKDQTPFQNAKAIAQSIIRPSVFSEPEIEGNLTGKKWLDMIIAILLLVAIVFFAIYTSPNIGAEISAGWAAFTANIWISLLYVLLFIVVAALLWAALDAMFNFMFPTN